MLCFCKPKRIMNSFYVRSKPWQNVVEGEARQNLSIPKLLLHALSRIVLSHYRTLITATFVVVSVVHTQNAGGSKR